VAENALGAHEGGEITGDYAQPKHALDTKPVWLEVGEHVMRSAVASDPETRAFLNDLNATGNLNQVISDSFVDESGALQLDNSPSVAIDASKIASLSSSSVSADAMLNTALLGSINSGISSINTKMDKLDTVVDAIENQNFDIVVRNNNSYYPNRTDSHRIVNSHR
jgi:tetrahydromethanopterin S-methyltransferase subunit B